MEKVSIVSTRRNSICGILSIPESASSVVVMSHGFTSSKDSDIYAELQEMLNERGIGTLRYDCYGHGGSDGKFENITLSAAMGSIYSAVDFVRGKGKFDIGLLGASFGGLVSLIAAAVDHKIKALALKSPVTDPVKFWEDRLGEERIKKWKQEGVLHYDCHGEKYDLKFGFWENINHYHMNQLTQAVSCPTLIVHGRADTVVPISHSMELAEATGAKLRVVQDADHAYSKPEHYEIVKRIMVDFLAHELRPQC